MPQGHFNVLKGAYPSLAQIDVIRAVDSGETGIVRGSCIRTNGSNKWIRTAADAASQGVAGTAGPVIYFALQDQGQPDVTMSGVLNALPCTMPMEVETSEFDSGATLAVGGLVSAGAAGEVTDHATGLTAIGIVTRAAYFRFVNDVPVPTVNPTSTGNRLEVIAFLTTYQPDLA